MLPWIIFKIEFLGNGIHSILRPSQLVIIRSLRHQDATLSQGSPEAPATGQNRHLIDLDTTAALKKYIYIFVVGSARKALCAGYR